MHSGILILPLKCNTCSSIVALVLLKILQIKQHGRPNKQVFVIHCALPWEVHSKAICFRAEFRTSQRTFGYEAHIVAKSVLYVKLNICATWATSATLTNVSCHLKAQFLLIIKDLLIHDTTFEWVLDAANCRAIR